MRRLLAMVSASAVLASLLLVPMASGASAATVSYAGFGCTPHGSAAGSPTTTLSSVAISTTGGSSSLTCLFRGTRLPASFGGACSFDNAAFHVDFSRRTLLPVNNNTNLLCSGGTVSAKTDLQITKDDGTDAAVVGTTTTYAIVVTNAGPSAVAGANVADTFPAAITAATYTSVAAGGATGNTAAGSGNIADSLALPAGASVTYTVVATISASATGNTLTNTATITAPAGVIDTNPANNIVTDTDTFFADLAAISVTDGLATVAAGTTSTYVVTTKNLGPNPATNISIHLMVMNGVSALFDQNFGLFPGPIAVGGTITVSNIQVPIPPGATGTVVATATVSSSGRPDPNPANDAAADTDTLVPANPGVNIVKFVNGQDADTPTGPRVATGSTVTFTYVVTNTGNVPLANVVVSDDKLGPATTFTGDTNGNGLLDLTETWTYTNTATAIAGQQTNTGSVTANDATNPATTVSDTNPGNYFGDAPAIQIVKFVNGQDADTATGPSVATGSTVTFTFVVTNAGNVPLANVVVSDNKLGPITSFTGDTNNNGLLDLTETWTFTATATAVAGQQTNIGTATGQDANNPPGTTVTDDNPANYFGS